MRYEQFYKIFFYCACARVIIFSSSSFYRPHYRVTSKKISFEYIKNSGSYEEFKSTEIHNSPREKNYKGISPN